MKKLFLITAAILGFQANSQLKSPEGVELNTKVTLAFEGIEFVHYELGIYDYALEGLNDSDDADYRAYKLYYDLGNTCINATKVPKDEEINFGYIFHFEDCDVWYLCLYGGILKGSVHFK